MSRYGVLGKRVEDVGRRVVYQDVVFASLVAQCVYCVSQFLPYSFRISVFDLSYVVGTRGVLVGAVGRLSAGEMVNYG